MKVDFESAFARVAPPMFRTQGRKRKPIPHDEMMRALRSLGDRSFLTAEVAVVFGVPVQKMATRLQHMLKRGFVTVHRGGQRNYWRVKA